MQELIDRLTKAGLSEEHAWKAIEIIKNFTKEKFPMFGGAIDGLFQGDANEKNDFLG